jgi:hypothetical protein
VGVIRRLPWQAFVDVAIPVTVVLFAFGSSSVAALCASAATARWIALLALAAIAVAQSAARRPEGGRRRRPHGSSRRSSLPSAWSPLCGPWTPG